MYERARVITVLKNKKQHLEHPRNPSVYIHNKRKKKKKRARYFFGVFVFCNRARAREPVRAARTPCYTTTRKRVRESGVEGFRKYDDRPYHAFNRPRRRVQITRW